MVSQVRKRKKKRSKKARLDDLGSVMCKTFSRRHFRVCFLLGTPVPNTLVVKKRA